MIVRITQTASNVKQEYEIIGGGLFFSGHNGNLCKWQPITLSDRDAVFRGVPRFAKWINYIPLRYLFGKENRTKRFDLYRNDVLYGQILSSRNGYFKKRFLLFIGNEALEGYPRAVGSYEYVPIYRGDEQIALVETCLSANDYLYTHKLYVLDGFTRFADTLALFVLYYANFRFAKRFHMSKYKMRVKAWSFSAYNDKYRPEWKEAHFPVALPGGAFNSKNIFEIDEQQRKKPTL